MRKSLIFITIVALMVLFYASFFTIQEGQCGIIFRFNKVLRDSENKPLICTPGCHIKIPFIEKIENLDSRIQTTENQADRFVTMEKKDLIIDSYIKWRIKDFSRYYLSTGGDKLKAEGILKRKFSDRLRSELGKLNVKNIITDSRNRLMIDVCKLLNTGTVNKEISVITDNNIQKYEDNNIQKIINPNSMEVLGIEVVDVRIKQINFPSEVFNAIYQRMRAEREAVARYHRSQGQEESEKLRSIADYEVTQILSEAERKSLIIQGEADAEVAKLYSDTFNKDPMFYSFIRSLRAYENSFHDNKNMIILSPESVFFRFMKLSENTICDNYN